MNNTKIKTLTIKEIEEQIGTLSKTSKMPAYSFGISALYCNVGSKLAKIEGTTCSGCYALKGNYLYPSVKQSHEKRRDALLNNPNWVMLMTELIKIKYKNVPDKDRYFRWFDSGDIPNLEALNKILEVCKNTPDIKHWIPTREYQLIFSIDLSKLPDNVIIRVSTPKVDNKPLEAFPWTSTVHSEDSLAIGNSCPALKQDGKCGDCRACWSKENVNISYHKH